MKSSRPRHSVTSCKIRNNTNWNITPKERTLSVAKISELTAESSKSFEDAVEKGVRKMAKTVDNIEGAWIKEQKVVVKDGEISAYRVTMKITFVVK